MNANAPPLTPGAGDASDGPLLDAVELMKAALHRRPRVDEFAEAVGMNRKAFYQRFKQRFGQTPLQMMATLQVERVKELLLLGLSPAVASLRSGFAHQSHMTERFRQVTGTTPVRWLREQGGTPSDDDGARTSAAAAPPVVRTSALPLAGARMCGASAA